MAEDKTRDTNGNNILGIFSRALVVAAFVFLVATLNFFLITTTGAVNWALIVGSIALLLTVSLKFGLTPSDIGLGRANIRVGLRYGGLATVVIVAILGIAFLIQPSLFIDNRYNKSSIEVLLAALFYIPLHTVLIEELVFRGVILGYLLKVGSQRWAIIGSSILFGLWHILPSLGIAQSSQTFSNVLGTSEWSQLISVISVVVATFCAGLVFSWLRLRSRSLVAPFMTHWAINASAVIFAALAN